MTHPVGVRTLTLTAFLVVVAASACFAQSDLSFRASGDIDARAAYSPQNDSSVFAGVAPVPEMAAGAYLDGKLSFSREYTTLGLLDYTFEDAGLLDSTNGASIEALSFVVNELYADLNYGDLFFLRLGKQRLKWGAGYVYNPSDPVNPPKDPTAARAEREGVPALKAEVIAEPISVATFAVLYDCLENTGIGVKLSTSALEGSDISVSGYYAKSESWTAALNAQVTPLYSLPGWDTIQLWIEGGYYNKGRYAVFSDGPLPGSTLPDDSAGAGYSLLVGGSGQIPFLGTLLLAEYYHLSTGLDAAQSKAVYQSLGSSSPAVVAASAGWFAELARRPARIASDYLFVSLTQSSITENGNPLLDKVGLQGSCLVNLVDASFFAVGTVTTSFIKDSEVDLTLSVPYGGRYTEFGNSPSAMTLAFDVKVFF